MVASIFQSSNYKQTCLLIRFRNNRNNLTLRNELPARFTHDFTLVVGNDNYLQLSFRIDKRVLVFYGSI